MAYERAILEVLKQAPRWHVVHWGEQGTSTLLCLWVAGRESLVAVDGQSVVHLGQPHPVADLKDVLQKVQSEADRRAMAGDLPGRTQEQLLSLWSSHPPDGSAGQWDFPRGGYLRWHRTDEAFHVEASEGGPYHQPMPEPLTAMLVDLGWNRPTSEYRNCWLQPGRAEMLGAAALGVLTTMAAFGYEHPPAITAGQAAPDVL